MANSISSTANDYKHQLKKLAPQGKAWPTEDDANWNRLLDAIAQECARLDSLLTVLIDESFPDTTTLLLGNWERVAGLPDSCSELGETVQIRRFNLLAKITARGGQTPQYYIDVTAALGFEIEISEYDTFMVDYSAVGDALNSEDWQFVFLVSAPEETVTWFRSGASAAGEPLASWGNDRLECIINKLKPAHTLALFAYG